MKYVITGSSDDNVCIEGDENDQFGFYDRPAFLHFSGGTVVEAEYCPDDYPGWRIKSINVGTGASVTRDPLDKSASDPDPYWDTVTVEGAKFIGCYDTASGPSDDWIESWFEQNAEDMTTSQKRALYETTID